MPILDVGKETHGRLPSLISALTAGGFSKLGEIDAVIRRPQKEHIANLKRVLDSWKDRGGFEYLSIETMVRVLMTLSAGSSQAKRMIKGAPINFSLGKALETIVDNNVEPG